LFFDGSDDARMAEADLMHVVAMEVKVATAFDVPNPRALARLERVQARGGKRLVKKISGILIERSLRRR